MAKKKATAKTTKSRQRASSSLPIKAVAKKKTVTRRSKPPVKPVKKKTVSPKRKRTTVSSKAKTSSSTRKNVKKVIIREFRVPLGPRNHLLIQLKRTKSPARKSSAKKSTLSGLPATILTKAKKLPPGAVFIILGIAGAIYFGTDIFKPGAPLNVYSPPAPVSIPASLPTLAPKALQKSEPTELSIPDIGLSTSLTNVGKQPDDTLEVPKDASIPGWYRLSPTPGEIGPSIIVGHVDSPEGPAIFWRLREMKPGQIISMKRKDNTTISFKVTEVLQFEQNNFPTERVYGNTDHSALRLITCGGAYNRLTGSYSHNTVVFASLEI